MKNTFFSLLLTTAFLLTTQTTQANETPPEIGFNFNQAPLEQIIKAVYSDVINEPLLLDSIGTDLPPITLSLPNATPDKIKTIIDDVLNTHGYNRSYVDGVNIIRKNANTNDLPNTPNAKNTAFVYRAKHRPLTDITKFLRQNGSTNVITGDDELAFITGSPKDIAISRYLVEHYDRPVNDIEVKASIIEYANTQDDGVNVFGALTLLSEKLKLQIGSPVSLRDSISFTKAGFDVVISAIAQDSKFNILDTTSIRVASGKVGRINVGQEVPVLGQFVLDNLGRQIQSVEYRSSGLIVDIKPVVINDIVHADISQQLSSFAITQTSNIDSPTLLKREIQTQLTSPFNDIIVLGGLEEQKTSKARSTLFGIPLGNNNSNSKTSLFLVLQFSKR